MPRLTVQYRDGSSTEYRMGDRPVVMVGRELDNAIVLKDPHASRKHFYIRYSNGHFTLVNLSQTHGTLVNGQRAERCELSGNEVIEAGGARITFLLDENGEGPLQEDQAAGAHTILQSDISANGQTPHHAHLGKTVVFSTEAEGQSPNLLATSDPKKSTMYAAIESGLGDEMRRRFRLMQDIAQQMVAQLRLDNLLEFLLDKIFEVLPADNGLILLVEENANRLVPMAVRLKGGKGVEGDQLRVSQTLIKHCFQKRVGVLSADTTSDERFSARESIMAFGIRSVMCVPLIFQDQILGAIHIDSESTRKRFSEDDLELLTIMANQAALCVRNSKLHDQIVREETKRANLERYFSPQIASKIASNEINLSACGQSVDATVLFTDIRDFTPLSERTDPARLVRFLNEYFSILVDVVFEHNGTLDKFIGDALVAVFGSPIPSPEDAWNAARCACEMVRRLEDRQFDIGPVFTGLGLHHGKVVHGDIGSEKVMQFTCIGDTVNTASRLCSIAKPHQIVISAHLKDFLGDRVDTTFLGPVELKGKSKPIETYELLACR
ncbi:GAF domain-containing protein [bacterium]|nr:GAF domain-containing protein [bacterium]